MSPIAKTLIGVTLVGLGNVIWVGFVGAWTLSGLVLCAIGGWLLGEVAAEAAFK